MLITIINTKATVRQAAKVFRSIKSTVPKDKSGKASGSEPRKARLIKQVLQYNKAERHIRGEGPQGRKYLNI